MWSILCFFSENVSPVTITHSRSPNHTIYLDAISLASSLSLRSLRVTFDHDHLFNSHIKKGLNEHLYLFIYYYLGL